MKRVIELTEYVKKNLPRDDLSQEVAESIWQNHKSQISVETPSFQTEQQWQLTSLGYVGYLPINPELTLALRPKVPLGNLFGMLEYAYQVDFKFFEGLVDCATLREFYERLANVLAKRVIDRQRRGLHRKYVTVVEKSGYVRGRLNLAERIRQPWNVKSECRYEEHTSKIADNQIIGWTLRTIVGGGICSERVRPSIRRAHRGMSGLNLIQYKGDSCTHRTYNRLNADYQVLHALCRFFLDKSGPDHQIGDRSMLPFLIDMNTLFQDFVAAWLRTHLPPTYSLQAQSRVVLSQDDRLNFIIDLVLKDVSMGQTLCVLDTKYKRPDKPSSEDIAQAAAYAESKHCCEAILVYPSFKTGHTKSEVGRIRVRSIPFSLDTDLESAGQTFLAKILETTSS
jgi:5-methylcytosine-specific restriction enzyme subunit McrC